MDFAAVNLPGHAVEIVEREDPQEESFYESLNQLCREINTVIEHCEATSKKQISEIEAERDIMRQRHARENDQMAQLLVKSRYSEAE